MLRQLTAILLLISFSAQVFNRAVIVLDYYTNTSSFAKNCENKARPTMHCNGKCQMMKKIKEEEKKEQQTLENTGGNKIDIVFPPSSYNIRSLHALKNTRSFTNYYKSALPLGINFEIFHPPGLV